MIVSLFYGIQSFYNFLGMQIRLLKFIRQTKGSKGLKFNKQFSVFLICFLIATVFWMLISLNRNYNHSISFPIVYLDLPKDKVLINDLPDYINLDINARGFDLLGYQFKLFNFPVKIKVDGNSTGGSMDNYLVTKPLINSLTRQLHSEGRVIGIEPDTLFFKFNRRINKKVPVISDIKVYFKKQYNFAGQLQIVPDSVWISGPETFMDSVKYIYTQKTTLKNINSSFSEVVPLSLKKINKHIVVLNKVIEVKGKVEKYTEATVEVPVEVKNNNSDYRIKTIPDKVKVSFLVSLTQYSKVTSHSFTAMADFNKSAPTGSKVKVDILKKPDFVKMLKIAPSKVEYVKIK
jgi:YbbR domain-containing protein